MNQSSSYKHLTVILAALMTCVVVAIIVLFILLTSTDFSQPAQTNGSEQSGASTTVGHPSDTTASSETTNTPPTSSSTTSSGDGTTVPPTTTLVPPVTNPPSTDPIGPVSGSAYGDKLDSLGLYAEWTTVAYNATTGNSTLKLNVYCDSYSLSVGPRYNNYIVINDRRVEFNTERISVPTDDYKARTLLYSTEYVVQKDSPAERIDVHVEIGWHAQITYSGELVEWLTLTTDFVV